MFTRDGATTQIKINFELAHKKRASLKTKSAIAKERKDKFALLFASLP
jgi:hypothetical protein